jgi:hypothetical protein
MAVDQASWQHPSPATSSPLDIEVPYVKRRRGDRGGERDRRRCRVASSAR